MFKWLKRRVAWAIAGDDLAELARWRLEWAETRRWLAEFDDVADALDHMEAFVRGRQYSGLNNLRDRMRKRHDAKPGPFSMALLDLVPRDGPSHAELDRLAAIPVMSDADIARFKQQWSVANDVGAARELVSSTDWDVAEQYVRDLDQARQHACDAVDRALSDPPTHLVGLFPPAPRRVAYKFLSPGCDARS